jgi:hypothetical protein
MSADKNKLLPIKPKNISDVISGKIRWGRVKLEWNENKERYDKTPMGGTIDREFPLDFNKKEYLKTLSEVMRIIDTNPNGNIHYVPAFAQQEGENLYSADIDACFDNNGEWVNDAHGATGQYIVKNWDTYIEKSVSGTGIHALFWWTGKKGTNLTLKSNEFDADCIDIKDKGWITVSGNVYPETRSNNINDLTDYFTTTETSGDIQIIDTKTPFVMPLEIKVGKREPTIHALVWSLASKGLHPESILACILTEQQYFEKKHDPSYVKDKVLKSYGAYRMKVENSPPRTKKVKKTAEEKRNDAVQRWKDRQDRIKNVGGV